MALIGTPFVAGYYSKHSVIARSLLSYINYTLCLLIILAVFLTSIYTSQLALLTIIRPTTQQPLYNLYSSYNVHIPLISISLIRKRLAEPQILHVLLYGNRLVCVTWLLGMWLLFQAYRLMPCIFYDACIAYGKRFSFRQILP